MNTATTRPILFQPITTLAEAEAFLTYLHAEGLSYHCDDDAFETHLADKLTGSELEACNTRMEEAHSVEWPEGQDPCGFVLELDDAYVSTVIANRTEDIADLTERARKAPSIKAHEELSAQLVFTGIDLARLKALQESRRAITKPTLVRSPDPAVFELWPGSPRVIGFHNGAWNGYACPIVPDGNFKTFLAAFNELPNDEADGRDLKAEFAGLSPENFITEGRNVFLGYNLGGLGLTWQEVEADESAPKCATCGDTGLTPGWVPSHNDPDNNAMHPQAEPCNCEAGLKRFPPETPPAKPCSIVDDPARAGSTVLAALRYYRAGRDEDDGGDFIRDTASAFGTLVPATDDELEDMIVHLYNDLEKQGVQLEHE